MKKIFITTSLILTNLSFAQTVNKVQLDSLFTYMNQQKIGAGSVSIFQNGKEVYANSYGFRDYEKNIENNNLTKFRIGSITKTFTATLIMKLIEEKKLSLDTKLSTFYPKVVNADKITIKNLLQHTSGLNNLTNDPSYFSWNTKEISKNEMLEKIYNLKSDFDPNTDEAYSNTNYILLSLILENVSQKSYTNLIEKYIIKPLSLKNTKVGEPILHEQNEAKSYQYFNNKYILQPETSMSIPLGAGFLVSTPTDLNIFMNALLSNKIVKKSSVDLMKTINKSSGLGLFQDNIDNSIGYGHSGVIDGFSSYAYCFDDSQFCYAFIRNADEVSPTQLKNILYNSTHGKKIDYPKKITSIIVANNILEKYANNYKTDEIPVSIKFFIEKDIFMGQATGQPAFPMTAISNTTFEFLQANLKIEFSEDGKQMKLFQGGKVFNFSKE